MYGSRSWFVARRNVTGWIDCHPCSLLSACPVFLLHRRRLFLNDRTIPILILIIGFRFHMCTELHFSGLDTCFMECRSVSCLMICNHTSCCTLRIACCSRRQVFVLWRMPSSGMLRRGALLRTNGSEELRASIIRVTGIGELGITLAVTSNWSTMRWKLYGMNQRARNNVCNN
jgi:hypothetical protein